MAWAEARAGAGDEADRARVRLAGFRRELYRCFTGRADALCTSDGDFYGARGIDVCDEVSLLARLI